MTILHDIQAALRTALREYRRLRWIRHNAKQAILPF